VSGGPDPLVLLDYKRRVFDLYAAVRAAADPREGWLRWRAGRDELFARHEASALSAPARAGFSGLELFDYDPALRVLAEVVAVEPEPVAIGDGTGAEYAFERFARARFALAGGQRELDLYWLLGYGGGVFLPFADATSGRSTYGAGRYLLDTVKGADLGTGDGRLVLDFNFAYNPSCSYDPRWSCPLAPAANRLPCAVEGGELAPAV
jgi:uncharacterized protein